MYPFSCLPIFVLFLIKIARASFPPDSPVLKCLSKNNKERLLSVKPELRLAMRHQMVCLPFSDKNHNIIISIRLVPQK